MFGGRSSLKLALLLLHCNQIDLGLKNIGIWLRGRGEKWRIFRGVGNKESKGSEADISVTQTTGLTELDGLGETKGRLYGGCR